MDIKKVLAGAAVSATLLGSMVSVVFAGNSGMVRSIILKAVLAANIMGLLVILVKITILA
jgi:hypothetical protein